MRTLEPDNDHADIVMYSNIYHNKIYIIFFILYWRWVGGVMRWVRCNLDIYITHNKFNTVHALWSNYSYDILIFCVVAGKMLYMGGGSSKFVESAEGFC